MKVSSQHNITSVLSPEKKGTTIPEDIDYIAILSRREQYKRKLEGCLTVHLPHELMWNANLMQQGNFIDIFLARHVSSTYAHHQEH